MGRHEDSVKARAAAAAIVRTLRDGGHKALFAGGSVRDELLSLEPTDYDIATDARPNTIQSMFEHTAAVGISFGVVLVKIDGISIEVATFRSDGPYSDRRRPDEIHFADPQSDAKRRDFTINALFLDPLAAADAPSIRGHVIDYVNGVTDLEAQTIRAVGDPDQRLAEDHLRALRAVRFAARLGFTIEPETEAAIKRHTGELKGVSRERIGDEIRRMMAHPSRAQAVAKLQDLGLDAPVLDEPHNQQSPAILGALPPYAPLGTALAAWAIDRGLALGNEAPWVTRWRAAMCLSNAETDEFKSTLRGLTRLEKSWQKLSDAKRKRMAGNPLFDQFITLLEIRNPDFANEVRYTIGILQATVPGLAPEPFITGDDLVAAGFEPGPRFKAILDGVYDAQLEGRVNSRDQAMELARTLGV